MVSCTIKPKRPLLHILKISIQHKGVTCLIRKTRHRLNTTIPGRSLKKRGCSPLRTRQLCLKSNHPRTRRVVNKARHDDGYYIAASPLLRSRACWRRYTEEGTARCERYFLEMPVLVKALSQRD